MRVEDQLYKSAESSTPKLFITTNGDICKLKILVGLCSVYSHIALPPQKLIACLLPR